ncbi:MAG: ZIP family metal transporter [Candidatus Omnitrophota bacterium]|jgi:zinc and cadmium transporter
MNLLWAVGASITVSLISLIGVVSLLFNEKFLRKLLILLIGFSAGGLIGGAFLNLLPESLEHCRDIREVFVYVIAGFILFFILEKYLFWRHCHDDKCSIHTFTYMNLVGDAVHNFADGLVIGASFLADINLGVVTTIAIIFHEIPQEIGEFGVLIYGGFTRAKALFYNFLSALTAVVGTLVGYYFAHTVTGFSNIIMPIAAGGFIYISCCDLIPEIHKQKDIRKSGLSMIAFVVGILLIYFMKFAHSH